MMRQIERNYEGSKKNLQLMKNELGNVNSLGKTTVIVWFLL